MLSWNQDRSESDARPGERALGRVADGLASAIHTLLPSSSAAVVVVGAATEWQLLAQDGPTDLSSVWRTAVAAHMRDGAGSDDGEFLIAPFSAVALHILLVLALGADAQSASRSRVIVQPLLDAGGILLDRSLATSRLDLPYHRTIEEELDSLTRWKTG